MQRSAILTVRALSAGVIIAAAPIAFAPSDANGVAAGEAIACTELVPDSCSFTSSNQCKPQSACTNGTGDILIVYRKQAD